MKDVSLCQKKWLSAPTAETLEDLQQALLQARGLDSAEKISEFFSAQWDDLLDPFRLHDLGTAVERIQKAIQNQERIMIFGDFDADGITSTVILVHALQQLGAEVSYRIPDRVKDGHGLKNYLIDEIADKSVNLIITCDCAVNDKAAVAYAKNLGIDVIVTDHHEPDKARFPEDAVAVINPKLSPEFPDKNLSGAAVAFKLIQALAPKKYADFFAPYLEVTAIGIVADCVDLVGENRRLAKLGLAQMMESNWPGLKFLLQQCGVTNETITENTIGFTIAPHLNAASRLGDVLVAVQLFLNGDGKHAERVTYLQRLNQERKALTKAGIEMAAAQIEPDKNCQILFDPTWKPGILGLIAARYAEKFGQPIVTCTETETGEITASCRAPEGVSMIEGLKKSADFFTTFGGHAGAAGFLAKKNDFSVLKKALQNHFAAQDILEPTVSVSAWVDLDLLDEKTADFLRELGPFGEKNPTPIFGIKDFEVQAIEEIGTGGHYKIHGNQGKNSAIFLAFFADGYIDQVNPGETFDLLCEFQIKHWNGQSQFEYKLVDGRKI